MAQFGVLANAVINVVGNMTGWRGAMRETQTQLWGLLTLSNRMGGMIAQNLLTPFTAYAGMSRIHEAQQRGALAYQRAAQQHRAQRPARPTPPDPALHLMNPALYNQLMAQYQTDLASYPGRMATWRQNTPNRQRIMAHHVQGAALEAGQIDFILSALAGLGRVMVNAAHYASEFNEELNKMTLTFGQSTDMVMDRINAISAGGIGRAPLMGGVGSMGIELLGAGVSEKIAASLAAKLGERAVDVSSLYNISQEAALSKFRSGLAGFGRPLKELGILINEDRVEVEAFTSKIWDGRSAITEEMKVRARANLLLRETIRAEGDYINTQYELANQYRALDGNWRNLMESLGNTKPIQGATLVINQAMVNARQILEGPHADAFLAGTPFFGANRAWSLMTGGQQEEDRRKKFASLENRVEQDRAYADEVIKQYYLNRSHAGHTSIAGFSRKLQEGVFADTGKMQLNLTRKLVGLSEQQVKLLKNLGFKNATQLRTTIDNN